MNMFGKKKCRILKEIRQRIADENDIPYVTRECHFQGECRGTCPRCESELRYLEQQLALRASMGKRVAVAALCAGMTLSASGCGSPGVSFGGGGTNEILGGMEEPDPVPETGYPAPETKEPVEETTELTPEATGSGKENDGQTERTAATDQDPEIVVTTGEVAYPQEIEDQAPEEVFPIDEWELSGDVAYPDMENNNG